MSALMRQEDVGDKRHMKKEGKSFMILVMEKMNIKQTPDSAEAVSAPISASDLPLDKQGRTHHLQVQPGQIAPDILIVGDPGRADFIGKRFLQDVEFRQDHRGLVTITGIANIGGIPGTTLLPLRVTVTTSGMGTPSLEIVLNELVALHEIDFQTRRRKSEFPRLHVIRVGSSGGLQASTELGTPVITTYAIGLDNSGPYYEAPHQDETCARLEEELRQLMQDSMIPNSRFQHRIQPYVARAEPVVVRTLLDAAECLSMQVKSGLTVSAPGFFAAEGRDISRLHPSIPDLDRIFSAFDPGIEGQRVENMEMESSFLTHFLGGMGHWAGSICPAMANRQQETFTTHFREAMENATRVALLALAMLRDHDPIPE
jgi:uridine phosphorylase